MSQILADLIAFGTSGATDPRTDDTVRFIKDQGTKGIGILTASRRSSWPLFPLRSQPW